MDTLTTLSPKFDTINMFCSKVILVKTGVVAKTYHEISRYMVFTCPSIPLIFTRRFIVQHMGKTWSNYYARAFRSVFWQSFIV